MIKKFFVCGISIFLVFSLLMQSVFAVQDVEKNNMGTKDIGEVPEQYQEMVNNNWAIDYGDFSENGYFEFSAIDEKVTINKYNVTGEKDFTVEYKYKYAGKDSSLLSPYYKYNINSLIHTSDENNYYFCSTTLRQLNIPFINICINLSCKPILTKVDSDGNIMWQFNLDKKDGYNINRVTEAPDGNVIIVASTLAYDWRGNFVPEDNTSSIVVLSSDGEKQYSKKFSDGIIPYRDVVCCGDKGFFAVCKSFSSNKSSVNSEEYLCAFDYSLNMLWSYECDRALYEQSVENVETNGFLVVAKKEGSVLQNSIREETVLSIDFDRNILLEKTIKAQTEDEFIQSYYCLDNCEWIIEYVTYNNSSSTRDKSSRYVRCTKDFEEIGELSLVGYGIYKVFETPSEYIICCWNALTYDENGGVDERECVYTAYDKNWNLLWRKGVPEKVIYD